jgi:hypothetical protein
MNIPRPFLNHLYMDQNTIWCSHESPFIEIHWLIKNLHSPITYLNLIVNNPKLRWNYSILNFHYLSHYLTNLSLKCFIKKNHFSFEFLRQTQIVKFNFKFILSENVDFNLDKSSLLHSFDHHFGCKKRMVCCMSSENTSATKSSISIPLY